MAQYLMVTFQAAWPVDSTDIHDALESALSDLRSQGAARAITYEILDDDVAYENWYNNPHVLHEVVVPSPQTITFDH